MKKTAILLTALVLMLASSSAFALNNFYLDGFGSIISTKDAKTQFGGGFGLGYNVVGGFNALYKSQFTFKAEELVAGSGKFENFKYSSHLLGIEYVKYFGQIGWRSSLLAGVSMVTMPYYVGSYETDDATGIAFSLSTGAQYNVTQHVTPFIDVAFHYDVYSKQHHDNLTGNLSDITVFGYNILIGVRFTIGSNRDIGDGY